MGEVSEAESLKQKSPAQAILDRKRANSVRLRTLVQDLDQVMNSIQRGRSGGSLPPQESPPSVQAAVTLFDSLEMLVKHDEQTASELELRVKELRALF